MRDKIIQQVISKIQKRSDVGFKKYGVTLNDDDQPLDAWLNHLQEELMDAVLYLQKAKEVYTEDIQDSALKHIEVYEETTL